MPGIASQSRLALHPHEAVTGHRTPKGASMRLAALLCLLSTVAAAAEPAASQRTYENRLRRIENPKPILADYPEFFEPITEEAHFEAPAIVDDKEADLHV